MCDGTRLGVQVGQQTTYIFINYISHNMATKTVTYIHRTRWQQLNRTFQLLKMSTDWPKPQIQSKYTQIAVNCVKGHTKAYMKMSNQNFLTQ